MIQPNVVLDMTNRQFDLAKLHVKSDIGELDSYPPG